MPLGGSRRLFAASTGVAAGLTLGMALAAASSATNRPFTGQRDGRLLVSVRTLSPSDGLYTIEPDGRGLKAAIPGGDVGHFSAHGRQLAFVTYPGPKIEIGIPGQKPFDVSARFRLPGNNYAGEPSLSPDGKEIVFSTHGFGGNKGIYLVGANGSGSRKLVGAPAGDPQFSPDGRQIIYTTSSNGTAAQPFESSSIEAIPAAGGPSTVLYSITRATLLRPELSPDGRKILFTDAGHDGVTAWTVGIDGTGARQVPGTRSQYDLLARWSPNGTRIAFVQDQSTLKVVSASGGSPRTIFAKPPANGHSGGISWLDW